jgi:hypothetical protein
VRRAVAILASAWAGMFLCDAGAVDITIKSTSSQSLEINSNYLLETNPRGETYISTTRLAVDTVARTPTVKFAATVDLTYRSYFGPGAELLLPGFDRFFRGTLEKYDKLTTYKIEANRSIRQSFRLQLEEVGVATVGGDTTTDVVEAGVRHLLTPRDQLAWSARATSIQFPDQTLSPVAVGTGNQTRSLDLSTTGSWTHRLSELTSLIPTVNFETISYDNAAQTEIMIWRGTMGFGTQLTKQLTLQGGVGVAHLTLDQNASGPVSNAVVGFPLTTGSKADWIANVLLTYRINRTDTFSFAAAQTITPDSLGVIRKFDVVGFTLSHRINQAALVTFAANYSHTPAASTGLGTDLYSASISYDYRLNRDWRASVAYRFRQRVGGPGDANSNALFISLVNDATILPSAAGHETPATRAVTAISSWPAAWRRPWNNASWWESSP